MKVEKGLLADGPDMIIQATFDDPNLNKNILKNPGGSTWAVTFSSRALRHPLQSLEINFAVKTKYRIRYL